MNHYDHFPILKQIQLWFDFQHSKLHWMLWIALKVIYPPMTAPTSCCSFSGEQMDSCPCKSLSRGTEIGLCVRGARGWRCLSTPPFFTDRPSSPVAESAPFFWSDIEATDSDSAILVFFLPFAGALAVRRRRWSLMERFRRPLEFVSTEDLEERLNKPRKPRSWWPWG